MSRDVSSGVSVSGDTGCYPLLGDLCRKDVDSWTSSCEAWWTAGELGPCAANADSIASVEVLKAGSYVVETCVSTVVDSGTGAGEAGSKVMMIEWSGPAGCGEGTVVTVAVSAECVRGGWCLCVNGLWWFGDLWVFVPVV